MLKLYEDKEQVFKCKLDTEGIILDKARMVLSGDEMNYVFNGTIDENGTCTVSFPALENFKSKKGDAVLEVITKSGILWASLERPAGDAYSGDIAIINLTARYTKWCEGGHQF